MNGLGAHASPDPWTLFAINGTDGDDSPKIGHPILGLAKRPMSSMAEATSWLSTSLEPLSDY